MRVCSRSLRPCSGRDRLPAVKAGTGIIGMGVTPRGVELRYSATVDPFDMWHLVGTGNTARTALFETRLLPAEGKRGEVFLLLLKMYRGLFPQGPCPPELEVAAIYERYLEEHRRLRSGCLGCTSTARYSVRT